MINYFYTVYRKDCHGSSFMFYKSFPLFIFCSFFSIIGFFLTLIYYFLLLIFNIDYSIIVIVNITITIVYPLVRIFHPGYLIKEEVLNYSKFKTSFIHYTSLLFSVLLINIYFEIVSLIMYNKFI
jgi:hypothetical protein